MTALILLPTLRYGGAASAARSLAKALLRQGESVHAAVLGRTGPWKEDLIQAGALVHVLNGTRLIDPAPPWRLHGLMRDLQPETIHAAGLPALRCLASVGPGYLERTWVSRLQPQEQEWSLLDRALLQRVRGAVARTNWEASLLGKKGFKGDRLSHQPSSLDEDFLSLASDDIPSAFAEEDRGGHSYILNLSRLEHAHGPRDALWAMDMMAYLFPDLFLNLVGEGSLGDSLSDLEQKVYFPGRTRLLLPVPEVRSLFARAKVCWITARPGHGLCTALEAQACGCPVVAYDQPALRELVKDGETGILVKPGEMATLARHTVALLKNEEQRVRMGEAGRQWVRNRFGRGEMASLAAA